VKYLLVITELENDVYTKNQTVSSLNKIIYAV